MRSSEKTANVVSNRPSRSLRVLIVEDSEPDSLLLKRALERGGFSPISKRVYTAEAMDQALQEQVWDIILCDHAMPYFSAPEALETVKKHEVDVPFIIVSGYIEEDTAIAAMKAGAHDYIMKDRLARLMPVVERELREAEVRRARRKSEAELLRAHEELEMRVERRTADLRAAKLKLENVIEERKRLENELLEIAENERRRIGFDLHDDLGQKLTGASMMIKGLEQRLLAGPAACLAEARKIHALMEDIISHTHDLAHQFSSLDMKGDDLPAMLKGLAANVKRMFNIHCAFSLKGNLPDLPKHTTVQLYKIAQEAVSNAIKHGKATQVALTLAWQDHQLVTAIKNNGLPFSPPAAAKNRMGLRIMNYRANTIGGHLEIKPLGKSGTVVSCSLPLKTESPETQSTLEAVAGSAAGSRNSESESVHEARAAF